MRPFTSNPSFSISFLTTEFSAIWPKRQWKYESGDVAAIALAAAVLVMMAGCGKKDDQAHALGGALPPPEVSVVTVEPKNIATGFEYVGQTAGSRETEVRARISGILEKRLYEEGSRVKAGTVLFQIDPGTYQTQLASLEAAAAVNQAKLNQARRELARLAPLAAEKAVSQKEFDDAKSTQESTEAALKQSRALANEARLNLGYTKVVAPISGITGIANKSDGSLVTPTDSLLTTLVQTDPIYVNFSVTEADFLKLGRDVRSGRISLPGKHSTNGSTAFDVTLKLADGSTFPTPGKMNFRSEKINPATGGFDARAQIPNPDGALKPGQFVRVSLSGASFTNAIAVPQRAVIEGPTGKIVFVVGADNKLVPHPVELDGWYGGEWVVTKGLQGGDRVLVDGFIKAHEPGMVVTPVPLATNVSNPENAPPSSAPVTDTPTPAAKSATPAH
jgi:membrane fusion protein (multidrug efflux system)